MYDDILFTHDDLDGAGCRVIYELGHIGDSKPYKWTIVNCHIKTVDDQVMEYVNRGDIGDGTMVVFADIVVSRETFDAIKKTGCNDIWVFDHHRSNLFVEGIIDNPKQVFIKPDDTGVDMQCGTSIMYKVLAEQSYNAKVYNVFTLPEYSELMGLFVDTVRSYDTYEWKQTGNVLAKQLNTLFWLLGMDQFCKLYVEKLSHVTPETKLIDDYAQMFIDAKMANEQRRIDDFDKSRVVDVKDLDGNLIALAVDTVGMNISELATQFLTKYPEYAIFVSFYMSDGGLFSFRTIRDDIDLSEYAGRIGGGGHPKASGASIDLGTMNHLLATIVDALPDSV